MPDQGSNFAVQLLGANEENLAQLAQHLVESVAQEFGLPPTPAEHQWPVSVVDVVRQFLAHVARNDVSGIRAHGGAFETLGIEASRGGPDMEVLAATIRHAVSLIQTQTHRAVLAAPDEVDKEAVLGLLQRVLPGGEAVVDAARHGYAVAGLAGDGDGELARQLAAELMSRGDGAAELAQRLGWQPDGLVCAVIASPISGTAIAGAVTGTPAYFSRTDDVVVALSLPREQLSTSIREQLEGIACVVGPAVPLDEFCDSLALAERIRDRDEALPHRPAFVDDDLLGLSCTADPTVVQALRRKHFVELDQLAPEVRSMLVTTLHARLRHWGHRPAIAADLHVHPQTVSGRLHRLRDLLADDREDPTTCSELLVLLTAEDAA
ncbi:helix-turn-helix domain-containing protein [Janibacter limosus]|uniref:Helix-turn-helix domain-containing protein n=1 Tax=Janibacter limosus TaxID=53458 RepID=A0AC61U736_9MICO|nr:helix-turn-helix domain-containing protein [Janibacter limosus]UUZ45606.1 helix-turn-helix domain-containing protein [Janibacter limosus]